MTAAMRRAVHYRKFHFLYVDVFAVVAIAVAGWFIWPEPKSRGYEHVRTMPGPFAAYGEMDMQTAGSVLYPGHFAFATPLGFASASDPDAYADSQWRVWDQEPFLLPVSGEPEIDAPAREYSGVSPVEARLYLRDEKRPKREYIPAKLVTFFISENLSARGFTCPEPAIEELAEYASSGTVKAVFTLSADGRPSDVFFLPETGFSAGAARVIEAAVMRGLASVSTDTPSVTGVVRVDWQSE